MRSLLPSGRRQLLDRCGSATVAVLVILVVFTVLWAPVLSGHRTLVGGDILYNFNPWTSEPAVHAPRNHLVGDPVSQFVPWLTLVRESFGRGDLPLWNPYSFSGAPLLANDQSSPFSPFTLLALLFADAARGLSIAMLAKLWVAGLGTALFLRTMGLRSLACVFGGVSYATSSFMVVWLAYPHTSVAAVLPWAFAGLEWYLRTRRPAALAAVSLAIATQFLGGHAETSLHLGFALAGYALVRLFTLPERRGRLLLGISLAGVVGTLAAGVQLVPFVTELSRASLLGDRVEVRNGFKHLAPQDATSWVVPNGKGNPAIDGAQGRLPNYPEATGFAGVGTLILAGYGLARGGRRPRSEKVALALLAGTSAAVVYGLLSPVAGRFPLLSVANNVRFLVVATFSVAALGALGVDALLTRPAPPRRRPGQLGASLLACAALSALLVAAALVDRRGAGINDMVPVIGGHIGFWVVVGAISAAAAAGFVIAAEVGGNARRAAGGLVALALAEGLLFAYPYNPRVPSSEVPPASEAVDWLVARANRGSVAALGLDLLPNLSAGLRLYDVRGTDTLVNPRVRSYWSRADPGYVDSYLYSVLQRPTAPWLAAAGVAHVMTPNDKVIPGTQPMYQRGGITISEVADRRPFAFAATSTVRADSVEQAADKLALDPMGPVVVEGDTTDRGGAARPPGRVEVLSRRAGAVKLRVDSTKGNRVVVLQSFAPGWVARVDGRSVPVEPANVLFQSVEVPAGRHIVSLSYRPSSVPLGVLASGAGVLGIAAMLLAAGRSSPVPRAHGAAHSSSGWRRGSQPGTSCLTDDRSSPSSSGLR